RIGVAGIGFHLTLGDGRLTDELDGAGSEWRRVVGEEGGGARLGQRAVNRKGEQPGGSGDDRRDASLDANAKNIAATIDDGDDCIVPGGGGGGGPQDAIHVAAWPAIENLGRRRRQRELAGDQRRRHTVLQRFQRRHPAAAVANRR